MYRFSEYVSVGHPDKMTDYITSYILDRYLEKDPNVRYALEVQIKDNYVTLAGEITTSAKITKKDRAQFVKDAINNIGYTKDYQEKWGKENTICGDDIKVTEHISQQSVDISQGVDNKGWGDQGHFYGYAENNTDKDMMPVDHFLAKELCLGLYNNARFTNIGGLDIKTLVEINDDNDITKVVVAIPTISNEEYTSIKDFVKSWIKNNGGNLVELEEREAIIINGTGAYKVHGPVGDAGTTGRKLTVDFYGGNCPIGGGSPWTKDATKADLTLNLYARYAAKSFLLNNVDNLEGLHSVIVALSCCIGKPDAKLVAKYFDKNLSLMKIDSYDATFDINKLIENMNLKKPIYAKMCLSGLFNFVDGYK